MSNCIICNTNPNGYSVNRIDSIANGAADGNGVYNNVVYTYTQFITTICTFCSTNIRDRNQQLIIGQSQANNFSN